MVGGKLEISATLCPSLACHGTQLRRFYFKVTFNLNLPLLFSIAGTKVGTLQKLRAEVKKILWTNF